MTYGMNFLIAESMFNIYVREFLLQILEKYNLTLMTERYSSIAASVLYMSFFGLGKGLPLLAIALSGDINGIEETKFALLISGGAYGGAILFFTVIACVLDHRSQRDRISNQVVE